MNKYLLDTNVIIFQFRNEKKDIPLFLKNIPIDNEVFVSTLSLSELYHGANKSTNKKRNISLINEYIKSYDITVIPLTTDIAQIYGKLMSELEKNGEKINLLDCLIAATALYLNAVIVTLDFNHFERLKKYKLQVTDIYNKN